MSNPTRIGTSGAPASTTPAVIGGERFTPDLVLEQGRYRLRFARTEADLDAIQALRYAVFNLELGEGLESSHVERRDRDRFDAQCQHLMVEELGSGAVVGTYRLQVAETAEAGEGFYTATEFELADLPDAIRADAIELGRACIAREHRSRLLLFLLWKGMWAYMTWNHKRHFFGCCSLTGTDPALGLQALAWLRHGGYVHPTLEVRPLPGLECALPPGARVPEIASFKLPKLFHAYLRYGAVVCGAPAIDRDFGTIDFLAFWDIEKLDARTLRSLTQ